MKIIKKEVNGNEYIYLYVKHGKEATHGVTSARCFITGMNMKQTHAVTITEHGNATRIKVYA